MTDYLSIFTVNTRLEDFDQLLLFCPASATKAKNQLKMFWLQLCKDETVGGRGACSCVRRLNTQSTPGCDLYVLKCRVGVQAQEANESKLRQSRQSSQSRVRLKCSSVCNVNVLYKMSQYMCNIMAWYTKGETSACVKL